MTDGNNADDPGRGSTELMDQARQGLAAWASGDLTALADLLDPDVELLWWTPGAWDCAGKNEVLALLSERIDEDSPADVDLTEITSETDGPALLVERRQVVPSGPEAGLRPATLVTFRDGLVVRMQQYRSRADALADAR